MVKFDVGNILKLPQLLKIPELVMCLIVLIIERVGFSGNPVGSGSIPADTLNIFVSIGSFYIIFLLFIGILLGDKTPAFDFLLSLTAFFLFLGCGSFLARYAYFGAQKGLAAMQIMTSFLFLIDCAFSVKNLIENK